MLHRTRSAALGGSDRERAPVRARDKVCAVPGAPAHERRRVAPRPKYSKPRFQPVATASTRPTLAAEPRTISGKRVARLRRSGRLPGVVFGHGLDSTSVSVDSHDFELLRRRTGPNALVDLSVDGAKAQ